MADVEHNVSAPEVVKYPPAAFIFLTTQFCERLAYALYTIVLYLYLRNDLWFKGNEILDHLNKIVFCMPLFFAAFLADGYIGKYKTILIFYGVHFLGNSLNTLSVIEPRILSSRSFAIIPLILIGIGSSGLRPCTVTLAAEQFEPQQDKHLSNLFSWDVFFCNSGSLLATIISPFLTSEVGCFGSHECYLVPFALSSSLIFLAYCLYICGRRLFVKHLPKSNMFLDFFKCIGHAVLRLCQTNENERNLDHWIDYAEDQCSEDVRNNVKIIGRLLKIYITVPLFWGIFSMMGSQWTHQGALMDPSIGSYNIKADQMMVFNPLMCVVLIPIFNFIIYPLFDKYGLRLSLLQRMGAGMMMSSASFLVVGILHLFIENRQPHSPQQKQAFLRIYNSYPCDLSVKLSFLNEITEIKSLNLYMDDDIKIRKNSLPFDIEILKGTGENVICDFLRPMKESYQLKGRDVLGLHIMSNGVIKKFEDSAKPSRTGQPSIRVLSNDDVPQTISLLCSKSRSNVITIFTTSYTYQEIPQGEYTILLGNSTLKTNVILKMGGAYTLLLYNRNTVRVTMTNAPNSVHILWQIPQHILMSSAEILFSIPLTEFSFRESPENARALVNALATLTHSLGDGCIAIFNYFAEYDMGDMTDVEQNANAPEAAKYPRAAFIFLIGEFCERMAYVSYTVLLYRYLRDHLMYTDNEATSLFHSNHMVCCGTPLFAAFLADSFIGKYNTIIIFYAIHFLGNVLNVLSAVGPLNLNTSFAVACLFIIGIGSGGLKPCTVTLAAEQFEPHQDKLLSNLFSLDVFFTNFGSLLATIISPILRSEVGCFGAHECHFLPFLFSASLVGFVYCMYICGRPLFVRQMPKSNVLLEFCKCITHAIVRRCKTKRSERNREHWVDYAEDSFNEESRNNVKIICRMLKVFITIPIYMGVLSTRESQWTYQGTLMDAHIGSYNIQPEHMQTFNYLTCVLMLPIFYAIIYPLLEKCGLTVTLFKKMGVGMLMTSATFIAAGCLQTYIENSQSHSPQQGQAYLRIYNSYPCDLSIKLSFLQDIIEIKSLSLYINNDIKISKRLQTFDMEILKGNGENPICDSLSPMNKSFQLKAKDVLGLHIMTNGLIKEFKDSVELSRTGHPLIRALSNDNIPESVTFHDLHCDTEDIIISTANYNYQEIPEDYYDILLGDLALKRNIHFKMGGAYTILLYEKESMEVTMTSEPNSVHIFWQIPQYVLLSCSVILVSIPLTEFSFREAPESARAIVNAFINLTHSVGDSIIAIFNLFAVYDVSTRFFLYAAVMFLNTLLFAVMAKNYKTLEVPK